MKELLTKLYSYCTENPLEVTCATGTLIAIVLFAIAIRRHLKRNFPADFNEQNASK